jgi:flagellar hook protein FlgE
MDALSSALTGMQNATFRFDVAANNVANVSTPGFQPPGGQAPPVLPGVAAEEHPSGVDLATEMVSLLTARTTYAANARVVDAARETGRSLLDALG